MFRLLKGLVLAIVGSVMRIELENGLIVETEAKEGFTTYQPVEVSYDFERKGVVRVEHKSLDRLALEETEVLEECPEESIDAHASEGLDYDVIHWGVDAETFGPDDLDPEDLAPDGAMLGLGFGDSELEARVDLAPSGASSGLGEAEDAEHFTWE